ncbi:MAG TPA: S53 family peptidase [Bryobacteraceae bacterium]|nr:S53 family peptidase [Bryobacteraceae bacterium]
MRRLLPIAIAFLLSASIPLAAQSSILARPPLRRVVTPDNSAPAGYTPIRLKVAYGFRQIREEGRGQTVAVVDAFDDPSAEADLAVFSSQFSLPPCTTSNGCFKLIYAAGAQPPPDASGWSDEIAIDTQWAHAIAPGANIMLVEAASNSFGDLFAAVDVAVRNGASVVSMSWGGTETVAEALWDSHFQASGVTFVASSGDLGHGPQYPAASPYVVAVGGTTLKLNTDAGWMSEVAWRSSGGGSSAFELEPPYQAAVQKSGYRGIPDVAYDADPQTGIPAYSSHVCSFSCYTGWQQWGGTSIGAPQWAALFAIANSERVALGKSTLTQPQTLLYPEAEANYHDIVSGMNGSCRFECRAAPGYDFVTGVGSPKADLLLPKLFAAP